MPRTVRDVRILREFRGRIVEIPIVSGKKSSQLPRSRKRETPDGDGERSPGRTGSGGRRNVLGTSIIITIVVTSRARESRVRFESTMQCNNARAKRVRIVFCDRVWRDQPRGKTKGGAAPEVDPDTRGQENTISSSESERIVIAL